MESQYPMQQQYANNSSESSNQGTSFLGGLLNNLADDAINYGSRYLEQQVGQWTQNM